MNIAEFIFCLIVTVLSYIATIKVYIEVERDFNKEYKATWGVHICAVFIALLGFMLGILMVALWKCIKIV